jgi:hypothetical protein
MATESTILRDELKSWENQFKLDHDGRKPSRADIKSNIEIAAKYKRFNSLRCPDLVKQPVETPRKSSRKHNIPENALRERAPNAATTTPRGKTFKTLDNEDIQQPILSPVKEEQPTPAFIRNGLGPTPQRDGHVLGIFDLLPDGTPSKRSPSPSGEHGDAVNATAKALHASQTVQSQEHHNLPASATSWTPSSQRPGSGSVRMSLEHRAAPRSYTLRRHSYVESQCQWHRLTKTTTIPCYHHAEESLSHEASALSFRTCGTKRRSAWTTSGIS